MKKVIYICLICLASFPLCCCGGGDSSIEQSENEKQATDITSIVETTEETVNAETDETTIPAIEVTETKYISTEPSIEYVETYYIYAEKGAVITKTNSATGEFRWKGKCESCGNVNNSENGGSRLTTSISKFNTSYVCSNSKCDLWGKGQPVVIGCDVTGEWIEVH